MNIGYLNRINRVRDRDSVCSSSHNIGKLILLYITVTGKILQLLQCLSRTGKGQGTGFFIADLSTATVTACLVNSGSVWYKVAVLGEAIK